MSFFKKNNSGQLTRDELQQLKWLLGGLLTLVSVATVFYLDIAAWTLMGLTTAAVIFVVAWPWLPGRVPRWVHRLAFPLIVAVFTADLWLSGELLPAMVRLDILLLLYRVITYRQKRDDLQVIVLGLFLVVVAGVLTVSLTFAVHILAFTACALAMLLIVTLAEASAGFATGIQPVGTTPEWARAVEWRRLLGRARQVTDWRVVVMGGGLFVGLVVLSGLLFVAIPRFQLENGLVLERFISKKARTGFSDTIRFGDVTDIQQDNSVALNVDVSDRTQIPATPYWRMLVLDEYREGTFRLSTALRRGTFSGEQHGSTVRGTARAKRGPPVYWTFYLESGVSRYLPLLGSFEELRFREPQNFRTVRELELVALRDEPVTMIAYRVEDMKIGTMLSDPEFGARLDNGASPATAGRTLMLGLPLEENDRATLARIKTEITGSETVSAEEFGRRASAWLAQRHGYSLQPKTPAGAGDPLVRWLVSGEGGHCEFFAGAFVVLARTAGIPARVVTGFRGGSWNGYSNNFTLRNSDAHAWCEVFDVKTQAWLRVDPTPGLASAEAVATRGEAALARRNDRSWKARLESLRVFWYRQIVSFDQRSQMETLNAVKQATENSSRRVRATLDHWGEEIRGWVAMPWDARRAAGFVSILAGLVVIGFLGTQAYRFWKFKFFGRTSGRGGDLVRAEAGRWLARLKACGLKDSDETAAGEVIRELQRIRFGMRETWSEIAPVFQRARKIWRKEKRRGKRAIEANP